MKGARPYPRYGILSGLPGELGWTSVKIKMLNCPACSASLTATEVLEACSVSVPGSELVRLQCPRCGVAAFARVVQGRLELGPQAGEGGAAFSASAASAEPELYVRRDASWVDCWHGKVYRRFPVET